MSCKSVRLHDEGDVERGGDVLGWIAGHGDDVCEVARRQAPSSSSASMSSAATTVAARIACIGVMPRSTSATTSLAFWPCGIAGASLPQAMRTPAAIALAALPWRAGRLLRLLPQFRRDPVDRHRLGQIRGGDQEGAVIDHHLDRVVGSQETVLNTVDPGTNTSPDRGVADGVRGDPHAGAVGFIGDRGELGVGVLLGAGAVLCDITPPDADTLISFAPWRIWYRTQAITSGTPLAIPSATDSGMIRGQAAGTRSGPNGLRRA